MFDIILELSNLLRALVDLFEAGCHHQRERERQTETERETEREIAWV